MKSILLIVMIGFSVIHSRSLVNFKKLSFNETMRIDFVHLGSTTGEHFSIKSICKEGVWPGSHHNLFDTLNLGDYYFTISEAKTSLPLYSSGFSSGVEVNEDWSTSEDCIRFPFPNTTIQISIKKRNNDNVGFSEIFNKVIDPLSSSIKAFQPFSDAVPKTIFEHGNPSEKVDIVILGDGYNEFQKSKFFEDAKKTSDLLFSVSPYKENKALFNVRSVFKPSLDSGITSPLDNIWKNTAYGSYYNSGNVERRIDIKSNISIHDVAAMVPYDFIIIITNSYRYGGVGFYHNYSIAPIDCIWAKYIVTHEFGHNFAGLADEYFTLGPCKTDDQIEPWEPNITANTKNLKWQSLVLSDTPIPTSWDKENYKNFDEAFAKKYFSLRTTKVQEALVNEHIDTSLAHAIEILSQERFFKKVGAFEGAQGLSCGLFRPEINCTMFTLTPDYFCGVCTAAIKRTIQFYSH